VLLRQAGGPARARMLALAPWKGALPTENNAGPQEVAKLTGADGREAIAPD